MYREHRGSLPDKSERFDLTKIQLSSKLSPKEFAKIVLVLKWRVIGLKKKSGSSRVDFFWVAVGWGALPSIWGLVSFLGFWGCALLFTQDRQKYYRHNLKLRMSALSAPSRYMSQYNAKCERLPCALHSTWLLYALSSALRAGKTGSSVSLSLNFGAFSCTFRCRLHPTQ